MIHSVSLTTASPSNEASDPPSPWLRTDAAIDSRRRQTTEAEEADDWLAAAGTLASRSPPLVTSSSTTSSPPASAFSTILLWLPYLIFTIVLLALIVISFLRFHCQRGHQYRRRQAELNDKLQSSAGNHDTRHLLPTSGGDIIGGGGGPSRQPNGTATAMPSGGVNIPQHMNLFVQYTQVHPGSEESDEPEAEGSRSRKTGRGSSSRSKAPPLHKTGNKNPSHPPPSTGGSTTTSRRPLVFTFNVNGSMVDIRCDELERTNTFRLRPNADSASHGDCRDEIELGNGGHSVVEKRHYCKNRHNRRHGHVTAGGHPSLAPLTGNSCAAHAQRALPGGRTTLERLKDSSEDEALLLGEQGHL